MAIITILYPSGYGHTAKQAKAVQPGIESRNAKALMVPAAEFDQKIEAIHASDAIIFGCPA